MAMLRTNGTKIAIATQPISSPTGTPSSAATDSTSCTTPRISNMIAPQPGAVLVEDDEQCDAGDRRGQADGARIRQKRFQRVHRAAEHGADRADAGDDGRPGRAILGPGGVRLLAARRQVLVGAA